MNARSLSGKESFETSRCNFLIVVLSLISGSAASFGSFLLAILGGMQRKDTLSAMLKSETCLEELQTLCHKSHFAQPKQLQRHEGTLPYGSLRQISNSHRTYCRNRTSRSMKSAIGIRTAENF